MNIEKLNKYLEEGWVIRNKHPTADLWIYNYSTKTQYEKKWDDVTLQCRGLILDADFNVIARPFKKFFNMEEHALSDIPDLPFEIYDKMDGSLGILYWLNGDCFIATRGSFNSNQAIKANELLRTKYQDCIDKLDKNLTYLFEIIYPENRIVVDYGGEEKLVLLGVIDTITGKELPLVDIGFPVVKKHHFRDFTEIKKLNWNNSEGFVIKFSNDFRMKIKFEEYVRLHNLITNVSSYTIWESIMNGDSFDELLSNIPDEVYDWVKSVITDLNRKYKEIEEQCKEKFVVFDTRKKTAEYILSQEYPHVLFAMLDNKPYDQIIWKLLKPEYEKPFTVRESE